MTIINKSNSRSLPTANPNPYRHDIDGLRAIAVIAVVIGHTFEGVLPRGYLGVDVFFAISGFVITMSLLSKKVKFSAFVGGFFLRRIKRLIPALVVCTALTCGVLLVLDSQPNESLITGAFALFGMANFSLYMQELDYFSASVKYNAFTHTWSLGVEEQFYLFFPFIFWVTHRMRGSRTSGLFIGTIFFLSIGSLIAFGVLQQSAAQAAYYMMPTRFWELGAGVLAALFVHKGASTPEMLSSRFASAVLIAFLLGTFAASSNGGISGHIIAVSLTTALLVSGASTPKRAWVLGNPASEYVGRISYSLYLWHWPFLTFGLLAPTSLIANPFLAIACAVIASVLSYHFIEQPIRRIRTPIAKLRHFGAAFGAIFGVIIIVGAANEYRKDSVRRTFPKSTHLLPESGLKFSQTCVLDGKARKLQEDTFSNCTFDPLPGGDQRTLWLLGDSHAGHLQAALLLLRNEYGFGIHLVETPGISYPVTTEDGFLPRDIIMQDVMAAWKPGDIVMLSRLYLSRTKELKILPDVPDWLTLVNELAEDLNSEGIQLLLIGPPPMFQFEDIRACLPFSELGCGVKRDSLVQSIEKVHSMLRETAGEHANVQVFETFSRLCPKHESICSPSKKGVSLFRDRDHLNVKGAEFLVQSMYEVLRRENKPLVDIK